MDPCRIIGQHNHDDGRNVWRSARILPPAGLAKQIYAYGDYTERTSGFTTRRELPHAEGVLIFNLGEPIALTGGNGAQLAIGPGEAFIAGAHLRPALSHSSGAQAGIHVFLPLATLRLLLATPMDRLVDQVVRLDDLLGAPARGLGGALGEARDLAARVARLDHAIAAAIARAAPLCRQQEHALAALRRHPERDIAAIARDIGWSRKHLASRIRDATGIGPRSFRRLLRFQSLIAAIGREPGAPDWAGLAYEAGYYDQPHMIREFREFSGLTPTGYLARSLPAGGGLVES